MKYFLFLTLILFLTLPCSISGQTTAPDSVPAPISLIGVKYGGFMPSGILAERYGFVSSLGPSYHFKSQRNWLIGIEAGFFFGSDVKEDVLSEISASNGMLINTSGEFELMQLQQRGVYTGFNLGKLFPVIGPNKNSGIVVLGGVGFIQHKIHFNHQGVLPQIAGEYTKGYDRLTNGIYFSESIGYLNLSNKKLVNFFAGINLMQGFTQSRRNWNFDTMEQDNRKRVDLLWGAQLTWLFPVYHTSQIKDYYYY